MEDDRIVISSGVSLTPDAVAGRSFAAGFRGYDQGEVRAFLKRVAEELSAAVAREGELRHSLQEALSRAAHPQLDEQTLTAALGEHAARLLTNAREAAANIVGEAETRAARIINEAEGKITRVRAEADGLLARRSEEAERLTGGLRHAAEADARALRERARAEAEAEVESARAQGREMVGEARALRERMLADLTRRRRTAEVQLEQLRLARQRLLEAYSVVRRTLDEATAELGAAEAEARPALDAAAGRAPRTESSAAHPAWPPRGPSPSAGGGGARPEPATPPPATPPPPGRTVVAAPPAPPAPDAVEPAPSEPGGAGRPRPQAPSAGNGTLSAVPSPSRPGDELGGARTGERSGEASLRLAAPPVDAPLPSVSPEAEVEAEAVPAEPGRDREAEAGDRERAEPARVEELFARMRAASAPAEAGHASAERPATPAPADPAAPPGGVAEEQRPGAASPGAPPAEAVDVVDESALSRRDELLEPVEADLVRQLKRALQDEQNEVLDRLRRQRRPSADGTFPREAAHAERYRSVAAPALAQAAHRGAVFAAGTDAAGDVAEGVVGPWAAELAADLVGPLRERLRRAVEEGTGDDEGAESTVADALSAGYRQCKTEQVEPVARYHAVAAFCRGALAATSDDASLRWVVDDENPCPDCDDNALAGAVPKGQAFPTGQPHPPAHVGCRCLLVASPR